ncbi:MAG: hypothetical protein ACYSWS_06345 [Planctomycetota bacterium]|jgi:hypothetical protein
MSILKLMNRLKKIEGEICGFRGGRIPKEEQVLVATAKTESEANKMFETLKDKLREKYGDISDEDVQCIWCMDYSTGD